MHKPKKSTVAGAGPSRSAGGRPRKRPVEPPPDNPLSEASVSVEQATTVAAPVQQPSLERSPSPAPEPPPSELIHPPEPPPWEPTPTDPPSGGSWRYQTPLSNDTVPSCIKRSKFLTSVQAQQRAELLRKRPYINGICTCGVGGSPSASNEDRHSMFCKLYKCYSYEASCCEGRVIAPRSKDDPTMISWWDCDCIEYAFDPLYDLGGEFAESLLRRARRCTPGHRDEDGFVDRPGGRALHCNCECGYLGGPYIPMCPFRPHGVTGLARGDMYPRLRAAWGFRGGWEWDEPPEDLSPWFQKRGVNV